MKKIFLLTTTVLLCSFVSRAQTMTVRPLKYDPTPVIGTWVANNADTSYYISFKVDTIEYGYNIGYTHKQILRGRIIYCINGMKYKDSDYAPCKMGTLGGFRSANVAYLIYDDAELKFMISAGFTISGTTATWVAKKDNDLVPAMGWRNIPDIPLNLTFTKISNSTVPPNLFWMLGYGPKDGDSITTIGN